MVIQNRDFEGRGTGDRLMSSKPVIVVVAYRRLHTLKRLLKSIENAFYDSDDITLIISIDYHPDNLNVIQYASGFLWTHGTKIIKTHEKNMGLKRHIIECGDYAIDHGAVIILEDDDIVSPSFYEYTRKAHDYSDADERIAGISLYAHEWNGYAGKKFQPLYGDGDVYFGEFSSTRGESWSAGQWEAFKEWYKNNCEIRQDELLPPPIYDWKESWGKFFVRYLVETNRYYVMPYKPVSTVFGEAGTHAARTELDVQVALYWGKNNCHFIPFEEGQHYDVFFENEDLKKVLAVRHGILESEICIDIYALPKRGYGDKRYVLTTRKLNYQIVASYDLNMRPHDANVFFNMPGNGIYFYDRKIRRKNRQYCSDNRLEYDFAGIRGPEALLYGWRHCCKVLAERIGLLR